MKKVHLGKLLLAAAVIVLALFPASALAHPGRTDKYGGHTDSSTGIYHYHHGHTAHLHEGGVCPYGDYEEWLVKNGVQTGFWTEADELAHTAQAEAAASSFAWEGLGIGAGAAAAAGAGIGLYRKAKKKRSAMAHTGSIIEYDPHMTVYVANNSARYHKDCGCCNAITPMELDEALREGRTPCPACCDNEFVEYSVTLSETEVHYEGEAETAAKQTDTAEPRSASGTEDRPAE